MAEYLPPAKRSASPPALFRDVAELLEHQPAGNHWFGLQRDVLDSNRQVVDNSTAYNMARARQTDSLIAIIDAKIRVARKLAEIADLSNLISEEQRDRDHVRFLAAAVRESERMQAAFDHQIAVARKETELAKGRDSVVRAQRNHEAALRVKDAQIDQWLAEAEALKNNAAADRQDTAADLNRMAATTNADTIKAALDAHNAQLFATLDDQIEIEKKRGNNQAVLGLQNARARLKAAA